MGIGYRAFNKCIHLNLITIPENITNIEKQTFRYCDKLQNVTLSNSLTSIANGEFEGCTNLESITIPESVTSIGDYAFCDCQNLNSLTLSSNLKSVGERAFPGDSRTNIGLPESIIYLHYLSIIKELYETDPNFRNQVLTYDSTVENNKLIAHLKRIFLSLKDNKVPSIEDLQNNIEDLQNILKLANIEINTTRPPVISKKVFMKIIVEECVSNLREKQKNNLYIKRNLPDVANIILS